MEAIDRTYATPGRSWLSNELEMNSQAGYSKTPLAKKLGYKPGFVVQTLNAPDYYFDLFVALPSDLVITEDNNIKKDLIHCFAHNCAMLEALVPGFRQQIRTKGMIWLSWPKKSSGVVTDLDGNVVRNIGLKNGWVDIKVCAINSTWSGLKFVIPVKDRIQ